ALAEHTQHPAHLAEGASRRLLDRDERLPYELRVPGQRALGRVGLNGDHAHAVRDLVVEVARDPRPFFDDRRPGPLLALGIQPPGQLLEPRRLQSVVPYRPARGPWDEDEEKVKGRDGVQRAMRVGD